MRTLANLFLFTVISLLTSITIFGSPVPMPTPHQGNDGSGCVDGKRLGTYYTDCYARQGSESSTTLDTGRLTRALYDLGNDGSAVSRKLIFNESVYYVYDQLNIPTNSILEGLSSGNESTDGTIIHFNSTTGETLFFISYGFHGIAIRDMTLFNETAPTFNGNIAIRSEGADAAAANATHFEFNNLRIRWFDKGIYIKSTDVNSGWQFDNAQVSNTSFEGCNWGMHLNSQNANIGLNNVVFNNAAASTTSGGTPYPYTQNGLWIERAGYVVLNYVVGNGTRDGSYHANSGEFIHIDTRSVVNMNSVFGEAYKIELKVTGFYQYKFNPITITNSAFPACQDDNSYDDAHPAVSFDNATVVSSGNYWGCIGVARPIVTGTSDIYTTGDRFCVDSPDGGTPGSNHSNCFEHSSGKKSEFVLNSDYAVMRGDYNVDTDNLLSPVTEILAGTNLGARPLLALSIRNYTGSEKYTYTFKRNGGNGWLDVEGSQAAPYTGYNFKAGPVQLYSVTQSSLTNSSTYGSSVPPAGSLLYCSDCTTYTTPCSTAGGGGGALAIKVNGQWNCR